MKRSNAFTLVELLTAMAVHMIFLLMLGGTFYALISFSNKSQQILTAREHGQRVIAYIDSRIRKAGLGMWRLKTYKEVKKALEPITKSGGPLYISRTDSRELRLPVAITFSNQTNPNMANDLQGANPYKKAASNNVWFGNVLTLLYAERENDSNLMLKGKEAITIPLEELSKLPQNITNLENTFQLLQSKIYDYFEYNYYNSYYNKAYEKYKYYYNAYQLARNEADKGVNIQSVEDFWGKFLDSGITNAVKSFDIDIYNKKYDSTQSGYKALLETVYNVYGASSSNQKSEALTNNFKDILQYVNTTDTNFRPEVNSILKSYTSSTFNYENQYEFLTGDDEYSKSDFNKGGGVDTDIRSYGVMLGIGVPIIVKEKAIISDYPILSSDELLYLKCERMFAEDPSEKDKKEGETVRNFKVQKLGEGDSSGWGDPNPFESGILEIYMEMDETEKILNLWVLSTGGQDGMIHERPKDWPEAHDNWTGWQDKYKYEVLYVSRASWKLDNIQTEADKNFWN